MRYPLDTFNIKIIVSQDRDANNFPSVEKTTLFTVSRCAVRRITEHIEEVSILKFISFSLNAQKTKKLDFLSAKTS